MNYLHIISIYKLHNKLSCESRSSCRARRAVLFDKLGTAEMHGLDNGTCCFESCRAKWNLGYTYILLVYLSDVICTRYDQQKKMKKVTNNIKHRKKKSDCQYGYSY